VYGGPLERTLHELPSLERAGGALPKHASRLGYGYDGGWIMHSCASPNRGHRTMCVRNRQHAHRLLMIFVVSLVCLRAMLAHNA